VPRAAARATELLAQLGGGAVLDTVVDRYPQPLAPRTARLPVAHLQRLSGLLIAADEAAGELRKISDQVKLEGAGPAATLVVQVPSYRPDLALPEDLVEEILRLGGRYESPPQIGRVLANARSQPSPESPGDRARDLLAGAGLSEVVTWGFVPRASLAAAHPSLADGVTVKNPISADYEVMRTSLLPGLAAALVRNHSRGVADVRLFEVGPVVRKGAGPEPEQREQVALLLAGRASGWLKPGEPLDFFDLKRVLVDLLAGFGVEADFAAVPAAVSTAAQNVGYLHPGVAAELSLPGGKRLGAAGELHPAAARRLGLEVRTFYAELDLEAMAGARTPARSVPPPRFPASTRDLSFWVDEAVPSAAQRAAFLVAAEPLLRELTVLEDFRDPRYAPAGKKGMLWSMTYRADDRTLTDAEADAAHAKVVAALSGRLAITIR
jgi:phenylalanyl-tRNA synthetase beta chain